MDAVTCQMLFKGFRIRRGQNAFKYLSRCHIKCPSLPSPSPSSLFLPFCNGFRPTDNNFHPQLAENGSPLQFTEEAA